MTIRNASSRDIQQLLNLGQRRPRREIDRSGRSPLRRPHIQILSHRQQDALRNIPRDPEDDETSARERSRAHQAPLPRRRPRSATQEESYQGTRAKHKARPYSAFFRVPRASASSRQGPQHRQDAPGAGDADLAANLEIWNDRPRRSSRSPSRPRRDRSLPSRPSRDRSRSPRPSPAHRNRRGPLMEQRMEAEANSQRRQRQMPSTLVDTDVSMPHNLDQLEINWASFQVQGFELPSQSQQYLQPLRVLADSVCNVASSWSMTMGQIEACVHGTIQIPSICILITC